MALNFNQIDAHVQSKYIPVLVDNVFTSNPILTKLLSKNKVVYDSGQKIRTLVLYGKKKGGSYSGLDRFDINPVKTRTVAEHSWRSLYVNITIVGDDVDMIEGTEQILPLVTNEVKEAELTIKDMLSDMFFSLAPGPKDLDSLDNIIGITTYGGINPSDVGSNTTNRIWQSHLDTDGGAISLSRVKSWIGETTYGVEKPDLMIMPQTLYDALWAQVQPQQRMLGNKSALAAVGFSGIEIDGTQIIVDRHCPAGYVFGLNTDYLKFVIHRNKNFKWTGNKELIDADAYVRQILFKGQLLANARRYHFKASGLTA